MIIKWQINLNYKFADCSSQIYRIVTLMLTYAIGVVIWTNFIRFFVQNCSLERYCLFSANKSKFVLQQYINLLFSFPVSVERRAVFYLAHKT